MKKFSFVIVAGGSGSRMGGERKQFRLLGGRPMWRWSAEMAASMAEEGIGEIVLVLPRGEVTPPPWRQSARIPLRLASDAKRDVTSDLPTPPFPLTTPTTRWIRSLCFRSAAPRSGHPEAQ